MLETMNEYKAINEKMGETVSLPIEKLGISEYNTRSTCIDYDHVESLAKKIKERGFHPKRAISVNVIRGTDESEVAHRVAAGIHRLEAAKKLSFGEIPCLLYYNLTDEEECLLDRWDNEMDDDHKKIHFLAEAEHCKYLQDVKGWSQRQIARTKGVSRSGVMRKLKIACLPGEAKKIIRGGPHVGHFVEKHFQEICKLSDPHIITICGEIAERGRLAKGGKLDESKNRIDPMRQSEIEDRVKEFLKLEEEGKLDQKAKTLDSREMSALSTPSEETKEEGRGELEIKETVSSGMNEEIMKEVAIEVMGETSSEPSKLAIEMTYRNPEKKTRGLNLDRCVRWLKNAGLFETLGQTAYIALRKIEEYDLWYRGNTDEPFFITGEPFALIAKQSGVEKEHIQKRVMPWLKKEGFLDYWQDTRGRNGIWWFALNWDRLFKVYCDKAYTILFDEDGLKDIPPNFTGVIRPTPFHYIRIEGGKVVPWGKEAPAGDIPERTHDDLLRDELRRLKPPMSEKYIAECLGKRGETEIALKLFHEMDARKRNEIENEAGCVLGMVRQGVGMPKGFVTPAEARERKEKINKQEEFFKRLRKEKYQYFVPEKNRRYEIETLDEEGFIIRKEDGTGSYCHLKDWMDMKYFEKEPPREMFAAEMALSE